VGRRRIHAPRVTNAHTDERRSAQRRETEEKQPRGSRLGATRRRYTAHGLAAKLYAAKRYRAYLLLYKYTAHSLAAKPYAAKRYRAYLLQYKCQWRHISFITCVKSQWYFIRR
jgi:hypothetical protein